MSLINDLTQINTIKQDIKNAIINKGQNITNFASYPDAISNIVSGSVGVKQYDSLENMYADISNAHNGDLATVYASSQAPITDTTEFQVATFPQTVVLDEALSDYVEVGFQAVDESVMFDCWGQLDSSRFSMQCYTDDGNIRIEYESQDGITYNRTRFRKNEEDISGNEMDFDIVIKFGSRWGSSEFNPAIGKFIISGSTVFDGVFQYNGTNFNLLPNTGLNATIDSIYKGKFYGINGIENGFGNIITNLNINQLKDKINLYSNLSYLTIKNNENIERLFESKYNLTSVPNINIGNANNISYMFYGCNNLSTVPNFNTSNVTNMTYMFTSCTNLTEIPNFNTSNVIYMTSVFQGCNNLITVPNFDTSNVKTMWGCFWSATNLVNMPNWNISKVTDISNMFRYCFNLTTIPNFNTCNVEYASYTFQQCLNLVNVPNLDTSNIRYMNGMFNVCVNLVEAPSFNMSKVVDTSWMFSDCQNLISVPVFNVPNITSMSNMFYNCNNLSNASIANIVNSLPLAINLINRYVANIGLNINKFTSAQNAILKDKGYLEFQQNYYTITYSNVV